ncbi:hypothetical protein GCM10023187_27990 [Nibrella viscosa]|uniref:Uncharacterized protein n=1 Tax=Nibrella viscosa TaxID=1084524 RepID=A0ABP8KIJ6_9BACT
MKGWKLVAAVAVLVLIAPELMAQCAMCRGSVESTVSNGRSVVASNLNTGILYLLAVPYLMVAAIAYLWYRNSRKEHEQRLAVMSRVKRALS